MSENSSFIQIEGIVFTAKVSGEGRKRDREEVGKEPSKCLKLN